MYLLLISVNDRIIFSIWPSYLFSSFMSTFLIQWNVDHYFHSSFCVKRFLCQTNGPSVDFSPRPNMIMWCKTTQRNKYLLYKPFIHFVWYVVFKVLWFSLQCFQIWSNMRRFINCIKLKIVLKYAQIKIITFTYIESNAIQVSLLV